MSGPARPTRRHFLSIVGATATSSILLKGCLGNPPSDTPTASTPVNNAPLAGQPQPEVTKIMLGYIPIVESAPLIIAKEKGFFAEYGITAVEVSKQASWGAARDNVVIGSQGGGIDGGMWQMPMPYMISEGKITTNNQKIPMYVLLQLNTHGNGIAITGKHKDKGLGTRIEGGGKALFAGLKSAGTKFKAAYTFPGANQELWIRYWFAANGINPDTDVELLTVPAAQTVANMKTGTMDAFSTGDPWPYRIVKDDIGFMATLTAEIWKDHPEEYLAIRQDWVDAHPIATKALLKGIMKAQQWCDDPANRPELAKILSGRNYFGVPQDILIDPLQGKYDMGDGRVIDDRTLGVLYWKDASGSVSYPYRSHDLWFLVECVRWGILPKSDLANFSAQIAKINREDLWKQAAQEMGIPAGDIPSSTSRGIEKFFDGVEFDPENPQKYLDGLQIKKV